jgi:hypothetical protein
MGKKECKHGSLETKHEGKKKKMARMRIEE